ILDRGKSQGSKSGAYDLDLQNIGPNLQRAGDLVFYLRNTNADLHHACGNAVPSSAALGA
ncbi:hypothetical protein HAX54_021235, partial [Datura stramonium]|nr:hypothetical protein [Datura stramonium]